MAKRRMKVSFTPQGDESFGFRVGRSNDHILSYSPYTHNCGSSGATFVCSCGFQTAFADGHGCWQQGHNVESQAHLDEVHLLLVQKALAAARERKIGLPQEWEYLEEIITNK